MEFKVGDQVKYVKKCTSSLCFRDGADIDCCEKYLGKKGTITRIDSRGALTVFEKEKERVDNSYCSSFSPDCFIKIGLEVGDKVIIINEGCTYSSYDSWTKKVGAKNWKLDFSPKNGDSGRIVALKKHLQCSNVLALVAIGKREVIIGIEGLQILEKQMNKYEDLKERIEGLNNGWDKDADDILQKIVGDSCVEIRINNFFKHFIKNPRGDAKIEVYKNNAIKFGAKSCFATFVWNTQCEKMSAFKDALLWLLDHSGIKDNKAELLNKIAEVEKHHKQEIDELREQLT